MTVKSDLQKALATCEEIRGSYAVMAESTEDQAAKQKFKEMGADLDRHIAFLANRLDYVTLNNPLNQQHVNNQLHPKELEE